MKDIPKHVEEVVEPRKRALVSLSLEKVNTGKSSYAEYLAEHNRKVKADELALRMKKAKETIDGLKEYREINGVDMSFV